MQENEPLPTTYNTYEGDEDPGDFDSSPTAHSVGYTPAMHAEDEAQMAQWASEDEKREHWLATTEPSGE